MLKHFAAVAAAVALSLGYAPSASALMMEETALEGGGGGSYSGSTTTTTTSTYRFALYFHGRSMKNWSPQVANASGWTNVTFSYDGSSRINSDATNVVVKNGIADKCGSGKQCVIHCYSAGCYRAFKAISDLRAAGNTLPGLLWIEASGSAAGGSRLAEIATKGLTGFLAKLFGAQQKVDYDLTPGSARNTYGYIQDDAGATVYHIAGSKNICKKFLWMKFCSGGIVGEGRNDGVVAFHSTTGASTRGSYYDGCATAKYPWRTYDSAYVSCTGDGGKDHMGIPYRGSAVVASRLATTPPWDPNHSWSDGTTEPDCDDSLGQCDEAFSNSTADFGNQQSAGTTATTSSNAKGKTSAGVCAGKCGGNAGSCWCDTACTSYGDCCSDYAASCNAFNSGS